MAIKLLNLERYLEVLHFLSIPMQNLTGKLSAICYRSRLEGCGVHFFGYGYLCGGRRKVAFKLVYRVQVTIKPSKH